MGLVFWVIWSALMVSIVIYQCFLGGGLPQGENSQTPMSSVFWILAIAFATTASFLRWILIPKCKSARQQLVCFIIGMSLSEAIEFYGLFLVGRAYPQTQMTFFLLSVICAAQFAPLFVRKEVEQTVGN